MKRHKGVRPPLWETPQTNDIEPLQAAGFGCGDLAEPGHAEERN